MGFIVGCTVEFMTGITVVLDGVIDTDTIFAVEVLFATARVVTAGVLVTEVLLTVDE